MERFTGSFTQQEPLPPEAIDAALRVMQSGRLHRYNTAPGEIAEAAALEEEFAAQTGARYCLAVASGGYALACALRAVGVQPGDRVLTNAFTLAPVPASIAEPVRRTYVRDYRLPDADEVELEDDTTDPLPEVIDVADVAREALALALPLYPRAPGAELGQAVFAEPGTAPLKDEDLRPFAGLAGLKAKLEGGGGA